MRNAVRARSAPERLTDQDIRRGSPHDRLAEMAQSHQHYERLLDRFTLRTTPKVNTRWTLYCLAHNIEKLARHGYAEQQGRGAPNPLRSGPLPYLSEPTMPA